MKTTINATMLALLAAFLAGAPWLLEALGVGFWLDILTEILIWSLRMVMMFPNVNPFRNPTKFI